MLNMELQREDLDRLYADTFMRVHEGAIIKGKIILIKQDSIIVNIGQKCEGCIPLTEFSQDELSAVYPGKEIDVYVTSKDTRDGFISLSKDKAAKIKTWENLENACQRGFPVDGKIIGKVKGGMTVNISGVQAFLPGSQIDLKVLNDTDHLIGQVFPFKIIKIDNKRSNVIVSRRLLLEDEREELKKRTILSLTEGSIVKGVVKNITDYGAFIDIGGVDGLLHISDMSWGRISHPGELFSIGDAIDVIVLKFDKGAERVTLGYKQKNADPWSLAEGKYPPGKKISGKVISIVDYGIFMELEEGLEGLVHISEIEWSEKIKKPSKYFSIGDVVEAIVLKVVSAEKKISLSIKQLKPNPWVLINQKYTVGQKIRGRVRNFTDFGAFISLDEGVDALLHISDITCNKPVKHPSEVLKKGQEVEAVIVSIDPEKERMALALKEITHDPWIEDIPHKYNSGGHVKGRIVRITDLGIFVELEEGVEGLIYSLEIEKSTEKKVSDLYKIGDELTAMVRKIDPSQKRIELSLET
ncbi:MAG: 30S ribosomal protein S1 [Nitrospirae bacterium]|nr:30S ribosomal protein S1 [Nitrospirota bacterium]